MKYRIIITPIDKHLIQLVLISRFKLLWLFPIWVEDTCVISNRDNIFEWTAFYCDLYNIGADDVTDLTQIEA